MAKDINIHVKTQGAQQTKQQLDEVGKSSQRVGDQTAAGHKRGADAVDKTTQKMTGMGRVLSSLKAQVVSFVGAYLGLQAVRQVVTWLIQKLERIAQLQKDIYQSSISLAEMGQALEMQTGTRGMQMSWTQQIIKLQAAGALKGPEVAQQMMISADIALAKQGGIKNQQVMALLTQLSPFIGAAGLGSTEVSKLFEFAGTAGIPPTAEGYKKYFAQLQAGYTASKATNFGQYLLGLQKGGTPYMAMGGTLEETISAFVGARAVMPTEELAGSMLEQIARLSSGAYEKPRKIMERKLGVSWEAMTMDERLDTLLQYVGNIPESRRSEVLAAQGFPIELTTKVGMMVSPEARAARIGARKQIAAAAPEKVDDLTSIYMESLLGQERISKAQISLKQVEAAPKFAKWQTRFKEAKADFEILLAEGRDRWIVDRLEPYIMAYEQMLVDLEEMEKTPEAEELRRRIQQSIDIRMGFLLTPGISKGMSARAGIRYAQELQVLQQGGPTIINNHYDHSSHYNPVTSSEADRGVGPRTNPEDVM